MEAKEVTAVGTEEQSGEGTDFAVLGEVTLGEARAASLSQGLTSDTPTSEETVVSDEIGPAQVVLS